MGTTVSFSRPDGKQASGHLAKISKGTLKEAFQGYDSVVLQNVFQDLQAKLGPR